MEEQNPPPVSTGTSFTKGGIKSALKRHWRGVALAAGAVALAIVIIAALPEKRTAPRGFGEETYTLVRDKISKSAAIALALPKGVTLTPQEAAQKVTFEPVLDGQWEAGAKPSELYFEPSEALAVGSFYTVALATNDGVISKDFLVDEDPQVLSIFPRAASEAPETSEITIVFNRPMVPLTTLDALEERDIPVEISPKTEGKFKWITARNLQFIPTTHLVRSAAYTVTVKDGFVSVDGLPVRGYTPHSFTTRPLRYDEGTSGDYSSALQPAFGKTIAASSRRILYNAPFLLRFNQPVDLERTKVEIVVQDDRGRLVPSIIEYGTRTIYDEKSGESKNYIDKSVLAVYSAIDRTGRPRFWDFGGAYALSIRRAYPAAGDILLDESRHLYFDVPPVVASVSATSPRSALVSPDVFDPQGKLIVQFYEEIDKEASSWGAPHLRNVEYEVKCKRGADGFEIYEAGTCVTEPDKTRISFTFDVDGFVNAEPFTLAIRKLVNTQGVSLLPETYPVSVRTFPKAVIRTTSPVPNATDASLTEMRICSNTPISEPKESEFYTRMRSNPPFGKWNWYGPSKVSIPSPYSPCAAGEFESTLRYGLVPESSYSMNLSLADDFGQVAEKEIAFTSGKIGEMYRRFTALQKAYNVTSPERTKLVYGAENLEYVNLHVCEVAATTMVRYQTSDDRPSATVAGESLACTRAYQKRIELPKRYWAVNYFTVDLREIIPSPLGHYILSFSHPDYRRTVYDYRSGASATNALAYERSFLTVTNLAVQEKKIESYDGLMDEYPPLTKKVREESSGNLYWVTRFGSLDPVRGARVDVYREGAVWAAGGTTDANGIARTPVALRATAAIVTAGADSAIVSSETDKFQWASSLASAQKTYIYTDRPIYRPGETVEIKGIYRIGYDGEYEIVGGREAILNITDPEGNTVLKNASSAINERGTFTARFEIPKDAKLGMYAMNALGGYGSFEVEEYAPAAFKLNLSSPKEEYVAGEKLSLAVDAAYYFGVPLEEGDTVEYSVLAQDYHFDRYTDGYFQFGSGWYYGSYGYGDRFIARGKTTLNRKGKATIEQDLDFPKLFKGARNEEGSAEKSKLFTVNVTVQNKQGQTVSSRKTFIVHRGAFYLGGNLERRYFGAGEQNKILVKSVDTEGKPVSAGGIEATVYKITWDSYKRQEVDGRFYARPEEKRTAVKTYTARTNDDGDDALDFTVGEAGQYELELKATDRDGNPVTTRLDFYVFGNGFVSVRPTNNETLELAVDRSNLKVKETANVVIKSPFERGKALITIERGRIFDYQVIDVNQSFVNIGVPIKEEYLPNVYFSAILLSPQPEVKYGQVQFTVSAAEKELTIAVRPDKKNYLPGERVRLSIDASDAFGRPVSAEVSVAVADLSVLALKGNPKKNPVSFFYGGFPLGVSTASNVKNILTEAEVPKGTKGGGGGEDLAKKKRGDFRSTAFWQGVVLTDENGHTAVSFTLPDNLTTWQSEVVGVTNDTRVGVGYSELVARKAVMITPLKPRFIVPGDTFMLGAKVFNQSGETVRFNIKAKSATLELLGAKNAFERIGAGESVAVYFDAKAPEGLEEGRHVFTLSAEGGALLDIVEDSIPITKNDTYESFATSFSTSNERAREYVFLPENVVPDKGSLTVTANSTLAMYMDNALRYLVEYPYGCSEQIASRLSAIAILKRAAQAKGKLADFNATGVLFDKAEYTPDELVDTGLSRIYSNQNEDGGFAYYRGLPSSYHLTLHILSTLSELRAAGYAVNADSIGEAFTFVEQKALYDDTIRKNLDSAIIAAAALEKAAPHVGRGNPLHYRVLEIAQNRRFVRETGSNLSLSYLALILANPKYPTSLRDDVMGTLENRLTVDGRGAFINVGENAFYDYYETPVRNTALLLRVWAAARKDHELADKVLRWLLKSRAKDGSWGSTENTLTALQALTEYLEWKREADSHFDLAVLLDGVDVGKTTFSKATQEHTFKRIVPVAGISKGVIHTVEFAKQNLNQLPNTFYYDLLLTYFLPIDRILPRDEGFAVTRAFYKLDDDKRLEHRFEAKVGEVLKGVIRITVPKERRFVAVEDFIPAGMELVNFKLSTEDHSLREQTSGARFGRDGAALSLEPAPQKAKDELPDEAYGGKVARTERLPVDAEEIHDDRLFLFSERLPEGVYEYEYFVRALVPGTFHHLPAVVSEMYFPENFGRTAGEYFSVSRD